MSHSKKCSGCARAVCVEEGWSNWTVEGAYLYCSLRLNPECPFDRWHGEDSRDLFAETCPAFVSGDPVEIDVDQESADRGKEGPAYWAPYQTEHVSAADIEMVMNEVSTK